MTEANNTALVPTLDVPRPFPSEGSFRSGLAYLLGLSWLFPQRAAGRYWNWPLPLCFLIHFLVGLGGSLSLFVALVIYHDSLAGLFSGFEVFTVEFNRYPWTFVLSALGISLFVEGLHLGLAVVVLAWGALGGERLRDSFRHCLRQVWLRTPHALVIAAFAAMWITGVYENSEKWQRKNPDPWATSPNPNFPIPPAMPESDAGYAAARLKYDQELADYQARVAENQQFWSQWRQTQPWYVRNDETFSILMVVVGTAWWLAAMFCAAGVQRSAATTVRSPLCLWCGYDLTMTPMESRCPECGEAVASSLDEGSQPGAEWERRHEKNWLSAWWQTWREAVRRPGSFGRSLRVFDQQIGHRGFLVIQLILIFLLGAAGIVVLYFTTGGPASSELDVSLLVMLGINIGTVCAVGATIVACGVASVVGWAISLQNSRNLLPAAIQVAVYCSPYLVAWAFFGAVLINCFINLEMRGWFGVASEVTGLDRGFLMFLCVTVPNIICGVLYIALVARGTLGARYANR